MLCNKSLCTIHVHDNQASIDGRIPTKFNTNCDKEVSSVSTIGIPTTNETSTASTVVETPIGTPLGAKTCIAPQLATVEPVIGILNGATRILLESATASDYNLSTTSNPQRCQINGPQEQHKDNPETHMITRSKLKNDPSLKSQMITFSTTRGNIREP